MEDKLRQLKNHDLLKELLSPYVALIKCMEKARPIPELYKRLDQERQNLHDEMLQQLSAERGSKTDTALQILVGEILQY